jgi:hypothetical protein
MRVIHQTCFLGGKNDHGNDIALDVAQLGQQSGATPRGERHVKHRKVKVTCRQRTLRLLDRLDRNDVGNFAQSASDYIVIVDMKDARTSVRIMYLGLDQRPRETVQIDWLAEPVQDIEVG